MRVSKLLFLSVIFLGPITGLVAEEMSQQEVRLYMQAYDKAYDENRNMMQENTEHGLLRGEIALGNQQTCQTMKNKKQAKFQNLDTKANDYYQNLGRTDGLWDGRFEGCRDAHQLMAKRIESYKTEMKQRWANRVRLGEKIAAIELTLFGSPLVKLEQKCLDARRVQGVAKMFLSDEVDPNEQLAQVQLDCQSQARTVVQRHQQQRETFLAQQNSRKRSVERRAASVQP